MKTPVVLFVFKRKNTVIKIIDQLRCVKPEKIYIVSDNGRTDEERLLVQDVRSAIENAINWNCTIIRDYAIDNRGVYENIGMGALRVFEKEERAIFLEDDNYPEKTFFLYCETLLDMYEKDDRILWICGTNYYKSISKDDNYFFTQNLLPCGWASWGKKFKRYYDYSLKLLSDKNAMMIFRKSYINQSLYNQQLRDIMDEKRRGDSGQRFNSWDYHMLLSLRAQNKFGIMPANNQIKNIGNDEYSIHGGTSMDKVMTSRFCQVQTMPFSFPITPKNVEKNRFIEDKIEKKILYPLSLRFRIIFIRTIKDIFKIPYDKSLRKMFKIIR